jgi:hypothetical protein
MRQGRGQVDRHYTGARGLAVPPVLTTGMTLSLYDRA